MTKLVQLREGYYNLLIHMSQGGETSSGLQSFLYVNKQFKRLKGPIVMIWFTLARPLVKVYQMI